MLSACLSQPIVSRLSDVFNRKSVILASIMMLGIGSLVCESSSVMRLLLAGRTLQGLGAGGLMVLSYALYGDLGTLNGPKFLAAISLFVAAGTVCGPFVGAALSDHHHWVVAAPILPILKLTTMLALDLSTKHSHVFSAWGASVQCKRHFQDRLRCGRTKTLELGLRLRCAFSYVDCPVAFGLERRW